MPLTVLLAKVPTITTGTAYTYYNYTSTENCPPQPVVLPVLMPVTLLLTIQSTKSTSTASYTSTTSPPHAHVLPVSTDNTSLHNQRYCLLHFNWQYSPPNPLVLQVYFYWQYSPPYSHVLPVSTDNTVHHSPWDCINWRYLHFYWLLYSYRYLELV